MKILSKYKNVFFLCIASIILSLMLFFIEAKKTEFKISNDNLQSIDKEYSIGPNLSHYHIVNVDSNNTVNAKPSDYEYRLINIFEKLRSIVQPEQNLPISLKRISELNKWGETIPIVNKINNVEDLQSWWLPFKNNPLTFIINNQFNSWESIFARYLSLNIDYINYLQSQDVPKRNASALTLRLYLTKSRLEINKNIDNSKRNIKDKKYLQNLSDSVFQNLNSKLNKLIPEYDSLSHRYDLTDIIKDKEYGIYNISVPKPNNMELDWENAILQSKVSKITISSKDSKDPKDLLFNNIEIAPNSNELIFSLTDVTNSAEGNWTPEINHTNQKYRYVLDLKDVNPEMTYMLNLTYQTVYPLDFAVEELKGSFTENHQIIWNEPNSIWKDVLLSPNNPSHYLRTISFASNELFEQRIVLESVKPLSNDFFNHIKLQVFPIFEPYITLKKITKLKNQQTGIDMKKIREDVYLTNLKNISLYGETKVEASLGSTYWITKKTDYQNNITLTVVFWPPIVIKTLLFFLITFIVIKLIYEIYLKNLLEKNSESYSPFLNRIKKYLAFLYKITLIFVNFIYLLLKKIKFILLTVTVTGILTDIFFIKFGLTTSTSLPPIYIVTIFWLITLIGYGGKIILSFYMSLILFILFSIFLMINLLVIGERLLTLSYIFLLAGSLHALGETCIRRNHSNESTNLNLAIFPKLSFILSKIIKIFKFCKYYIYLIDKLLTIILKNIDTLIRQIPPKLLNPRLYIFYQRIKIYLGKLINYSTKSTSWFLTTIVIIYLIVLLINAGLHSLDLFRTRESRNPVVTKFEPRLVYYATKVVIKGKNFGWQTEGEKLVSNFGKVSTDLWTNQEIIFTIPLHWKTGDIRLWIEKPNIWQDEPIISKSKILILWLLPITESFTDDATEFYEQMSLTDKETQKLNGY